MEQKNVVEIKVRTVVKFTAAAWLTWTILESLNKSAGRAVFGKKSAFADATAQVIGKVIPEEDSKPASGNKKTVRVDSKKS